MDFSNYCANPTVPVQIIDVGPVLSSSCISTEEELRAYFQKNDNETYRCRFISICAENSLGPLQVTKSVLDHIVAEHDIDSSIWDLPSFFRQEGPEIEENIFLPYTELCSGSVIEMSYTIRYPEFRRSRWVIRQSGLYHRFDTRTSQSLFILFSPTPNSRAHCEASDWLNDFEAKIGNDHFWLHRLLFSTYFPKWRGYLVSLERRFWDPANKTFSTFIDEPLSVGYDNLSSLKRTEGLFLQVPTMLEAAKDVLDELHSTLSPMSHLESSLSTFQFLKNQRRHCVSYSRTASHLQERVQSVAGLLADTLLLRDQILTKEQNQQIFQLNKSAFILTAFTLFYLPSSFLATIFGMNFFAMDQVGNRIIATPMIWIFFLSATLLTAATFLIYYWLRRRESPGFSRLIGRLEVFLRALKTVSEREEKNNHSEKGWFQSLKYPLRKFWTRNHERQDNEA